MMDLEKLKKEVYAEKIATGCTEYGLKMIWFMPLVGLRILPLDN